MWRYRWIFQLADEPLGWLWSLTTLLGLSLILLGVLILIEPALLAVLVALALIATGALLLIPALLAAWMAWRQRPRRIRIRLGR